MIMKLLRFLFPQTHKKQIPLNDMKYLIAGLGNFGIDYVNTRHNIGFEAVDFICKKLDGSWRADHHGDLAEGGQSEAVEAGTGLEAQGGVVGQHPALVHGLDLGDLLGTLALQRLEEGQAGRSGGATGHVLSALRRAG